MDAAGVIRRAIDQCGQPVTLLQSGGPGVGFTACILPRLYADSTRRPELLTVHGPRDPREFVCYAPAHGGGALLKRGSLLEADGRRFYVALCHDYYYGGERAYRWAALVPAEDGGDGDGPLYKA